MEITTSYPAEPSEKSRGVALALAAILGPFGAHRFYAGKTGTGVLMAATLGGLGVWYLYDLILVASGSFRDVEGRLIRRWDRKSPRPSGRDPRRSSRSSISFGSR
jgi:TM2 domain-containing membrane protein YozV